MSKIKWTGVFAYSAIEMTMTGVFPKISLTGYGSILIPIARFSVVGGAKRLIDMTNASDMSLASELEQARVYKNIKLFLLPTSVFTSGELNEIRTKGLAVKFSVTLSGRVGNTVTQSVRFESESARLIETNRKEDAAGKSYLHSHLQFEDAALTYVSPVGKAEAAEVW